MDTSAWGRREAADSLHRECSFFLKYIHYSRSGDWLQEVLAGRVPLARGRRLFAAESPSPVEPDVWAAFIYLNFRIMKGI